jgi:Ni/Co efflux regulator RcnB
MKKLFSFLMLTAFVTSSSFAQSTNAASKATEKAAEKMEKKAAQKADKSAQKTEKQAEKAAEKTEKAAAKPAAAKPSPAATTTGKSGDANITLTYAQPAVKGRKVWGELVPFDKVWRTGANDATTIEFSKDVTIEGQALKAGKYALFTIPTEGGEWTFIFNKTAKQWGSYSYKEADDALRVKVKSGKSASFTERMTFEVKDKKVVFSWENLSAAFKVE